MMHLFEFIVGFAMAMVAELVWRAMTRVILGTPPHLSVLFLGTPEQARARLVFAAWLVTGGAGTVILGASLVTGAWAQVITIGAGAVAWVMYRMMYYRVRDIMRAEARAHREQG